MPVEGVKCGSLGFCCCREVKVSRVRVPKGVMWKVLKINTPTSQFRHKTSAARTDGSLSWVRTQKTILHPMAEL